ncbi:MAG: response regulator transcription factor [Candidatus Solibacter usitatus]|nr:response regulator transcription factor [Candidatus Solibacter usitatus]
MDSTECMAGTIQLLVIDDDVKLCRLVRDYLKPHGFDVDFAHTGPEGLARAQEQGVQAVILDVMLPGMDGFEVLRRLRASSSVPVLMLTGRGDETDRIVGLEVGADDYLPKTFSTRELLARLRAVLRRASSQAKDGEAVELPIEVAELCIDPASRTAKLAGRILTLTPVEFDLLLALARALGRVKTREQLLHDASSREYEVFDRSIDVHISSLRRKLGDDTKRPRFIQTVRAAGYMMPRPGSEDLA